MTVTLYTPSPERANDIAEIIRLFFGSVPVFVNEPGGDFSLYHEETIRNGERDVKITDGTLGSSRTFAVSSDPVIDKRLYRRQLKLCAYDVLKARTGWSPPWGSLTGVRPTRLLYAEMARGKTMDEASAEMRTLFDLSLEKAGLLCETVKTQTELPPPCANEVDLYMGIPFCASRCAYCSFLSGEVGDGRLLAPYTDALADETQKTVALIETLGLRPRAFYMGGGTPTALSAPLLRCALTAASPYIAACREVTVEAGRPDTIDREKLSVLLDAGVSRISVNPQTMHDSTLRLIGRAHTRAQTEEAFSLARSMGFSHINMDIIAGLPGEDEEKFSETLAWIRGLAPESLTVHTLCIKRASLMHLWQSVLPNGDMAAAMVREGLQTARKMGMRPYYLYRQKYMAGSLENAGYALPGRECLYNVDMMEETANVLAVGAGGASKRIRADSEKIEHIYNVSDISQYIRRAGEMADRKAALWKIYPIPSMRSF